MNIPADLIPGQFVKVSLTRTLSSFFSPETVEQTFWVFARYISTVDRQIVVEYADGSRVLIDGDHVHPLDTVAASDEGGAST